MRGENEQKILQRPHRTAAAHCHAAAKISFNQPRVPELETRRCELVNANMHAGRGRAHDCALVVAIKISRRRSRPFRLAGVASRSGLRIARSRVVCQDGRSRAAVSTCPSPRGLFGFHVATPGVAAVVFRP